MSDAAAALPTPEPIDLMGLGLKGLFRKDGVPYDMTPGPIKQLPDFYRAAATEVWWVLMEVINERGELDEWLITSRIAARTKPGQDDERSLSFVYKGLYALEKLAGMILRIRQHGRRVIRIAKGLLGWDRTKEKKNDNDALVVVVSSDPSEGVQGAPAASPAADPPSDQVEALLKRARELVDGTSAGAIGDAVTVFTAEWVGKALDVVEKRNRKPGNVRKDWGYVLGILRNWRAKGGPPDDPAPGRPPAAPTEAAGGSQDGRKAPWSAEDLAGVLGQCREGPQPFRKIARANLREAIEEGLISPELVATIPPELVRRE